MPSPSEAAARRAGIGAAATSAKTKSVAKSKVADKTKCTAKATSKPSINVLVKKSTTRTMPKNCVVDAAVEKAEEAELAVKTAVVAEKGEAASSKRRVLSTINYKEVEDDDDDSMLDENRTMMKKKAVTSKKKSRSIDDDDEYNDDDDDDDNDGNRIFPQVEWCSRMKPSIDELFICLVITSTSSSALLSPNDCIL